MLAEHKTKDDSYVFTYTQTKVGDSTTTQAVITVRVIWDECTAQMTVASTYASSYDYQIASGRNTVALGNFDSGDCDSRVEFFIDGVLLTNPVNTYFGYTSYATSGRSFTVTVPYTYSGTTVNGSTDIWWETSDYSIAGTHSIKLRFYTVEYYS